VLQHVIVDALGRYRRVDFAWPEYMVAAEYDSEAWHSGSDALRRDREKLAAIQELGWTVIPIVGNDVRSNRQRLVNRIATHLQRNQAV
jgi:very-short-patch-repair endonuclease